MKSENIIFFQPIFSVWHSLSLARETPVIILSDAHSASKKVGAWAVNGLKRRLIEAAFVIATIFSLIYSVISYPYRLYQMELSREKGIELDLARMTLEEQEETSKMIYDYFTKHHDQFDSPSTKEKNLLVRKIVSQCARSKKVYGPIVRHWVDHLLETAHRDQKKLVFMARDGIPFYQVAKQLMRTAPYKEKYPDLAREDALVLGHFSRKLVIDYTQSSEGKERFERYLAKDLGIQKGDRCLFVDIGFSGSMTAPIRKLLPEVEIDFHFLVATSNKAKGFLGNPDDPLPHLETAANNLGVRWTEESHHGTNASATELVEGKDQHIYANTLYPKKIRCDAKFSTPYLLRKFCLRGLVQTAVHLPPLSQAEAAKARELFSQTIGEIKNAELPLFVGWDY